MLARLSLKVTRWALLLLAAMAPCAHAVEYTGIDAAASKLAFTFSEMGVDIDGSFAHFIVRLNFDPARPEAAHVALDVQMSSVDAGSEEATTEVAGADWFDSAHYPVSQFVSTGAKLLAPGRYQLSGNLSIKGRTRAISVPVNYQAQGARGVLSGEFRFNRNDFGVGAGEWADPSVVADSVRVRFSLTATAAR
jgi:polyisoprenoid-binding protein YceI